jgi:peptidoglycan/xylan/chitin deacetylase (PgdA/CDA1 family)
MSNQIVAGPRRGVTARLRTLLYTTAGRCGGFRLARWLTRRQARILAYHGFAARDEAGFRPKLFITGSTFARRLELLKREGYRVITMDQASRELSTGTVRPDTVVITIDDGFANTLSIAAPLLRSHGFPALVYLTTYHVATQTPVFDLAVAYLFHRRQADRLVLPGTPGLTDLPLDSRESVDRAVAAVVAIGHALQTEGERVQLCERLRLALAADVGDDELRQSFRLLSPAEAKALRGFGVDIGLHTHRHRFPPGESDVCAQEIEDNRAYLVREVGPPTPHFCYPSGIYGPGHASILARQGLATATTCDTGLADHTQPAYQLRRLLDGEELDDLQFEAELSGLPSLLRRLAGREPSGVAP